MKVDTEKSEYVHNDMVFVTNRGKDDGSDHFALQGTFCIAQRHMDEKEVTPVDISIGGWETYEGGMKRKTQIVFRPGKCEQLFAEWFCGRSLNKKPANI